MRLPVVASDTTATREVVTHMRDGLLFPVGDVDKLTDMVELALSSVDLRLALVMRAFQKARGPMSAATSAAMLASVVDSVVGSSRDRKPVRAQGAVSGSAALAA